MLTVGLTGICSGSARIGKSSFATIPVLTGLGNLNLNLRGHFHEEQYIYMILMSLPVVLLINYKGEN